MNFSLGMKFNFKKEFEIVYNHDQDQNNTKQAKFINTLDP